MRPIFDDEARMGILSHLEEALQPKNVLLKIA